MYQNSGYEASFFNALLFGSINGLRGETLLKFNVYLDKKKKTSSNNQCFCEGLVIGDYCERCASKPNSFFREGICQCNNGFADVNGVCTLKTTVSV